MRSIFDLELVLRILVTNSPTAEISNPSHSTFKKADTKLYVPVFTLLTEDVNKVLEKLKTGFKRTIKCNRDRSQMTR